MAYPSKPWSNGQTHEIVPGEFFIYNSAQGVWQHLTKATLDSDYQVDKAVQATVDSRFEQRLDSDEIVIQLLNTNVSGIIARADTDSDRLTTTNTTVGTHTTQIGQIQSILIAHKQEHNADSDALAALKIRVGTIELLSDSEAGRVEEQIARINAAYAMLDSDTLDIQSLSTGLSAVQLTVDTLDARFDSDELLIAQAKTSISQIQSILITHKQQINADSDRLVSTAANLQAQITAEAADHDSDVAVLNTAINAVVTPIVSASAPTGRANQLWLNLNDGRLYYWNTTESVYTEVVAGA